MATPCVPIDLLVAVARQVPSTGRERAAGAGETVETGIHKIGYQTCFGDEVTLAPCMSFGLLILQALIWSDGTLRPNRRRLVKLLSKGMRFERLSGSASAVRIEPSRLDARTWMYDVSMFRPDIEVVGDKRRDRRRSD